jgi:excisionase family DNA binding protein
MMRSDYPRRDVWIAEEAADYLACSEAHVRDLARTGRLRSFRSGRLLRFRRVDVEKYVECASSGSEAGASASGDKEAESERRWALRVIKQPGER